MGPGVRLLLVALVAVSTAVVCASPAPAAVDPCEATPRAFFRDVDDDATAAPAVDCLVWHDLISGVGYDRFAPTSPITRGQLATLLDAALTRLDGPLPDPGSRRFADTSGTHGPAIERLAAAGLVEGRSIDAYEPHEPVLRGQLASLLVAAYAHLGGPEPTTAGGDHPFVDVDGSVHEASIAHAAAEGLVSGTTATTFEPARAGNRGQTAIVLAQLLTRMHADDSSALDEASGYAWRSRTVPPGLRTQMERHTWRAGCPVPPEDLRLLELVHTDFDGTDRWGLLVVHADVAADVAGAFGELHALGFPIARMQPVERFGGDDDASMAANNTSAFNCRRVTGGTGFSEHSHGHAIDINPVQNPYVRDDVVLPEAGRAHLDRDAVRPGMLVGGDAVAAFERIGWGWGGDFTSLKDYQHVSASGR